MPVAAGIIGNPNRPTVIALIQVTAQVCGTANLDGPHGPKMSKRQLMSFPISWPKSPKDIGDF